MLDDQNDKSMQRNQIIAMAIMLVFIGVWSYFFMPKRPEPAAAPPQQAQQETPAASTDTLVIPAPETPAAPASEAAATTPAAETDASGLPPVATETTPDDLVVLRNGALELEFTKVGARLEQANVLLGEKGIDSIHLIPKMAEVPPAESVYPLGLRFASNYLGDSLNVRRWNAAPAPDGTGVTFSIEVPGQARIEKIFTLNGDTHTVSVDVRYTNLSSEPRILGVDTKEPAVSLLWEPQTHTEDEANKIMPQKLIWHVQGVNERTATTALKAPAVGQLYSERKTNAEWAAIRSAYFVVAFKPEFEGGDLWVNGVHDRFTLGAGVPRAEVLTGQTLHGAYSLYLGPNQKSYLAEAWPTLPAVLEFFEMFSIMDTFAKMLLNMLNWTYNNIFANYGVAIILLTIIVRLCVFPLTWKSMISMKKMQKLAPEMEKLKAEYKDQPEEFQKKMMEMYRERGVNPLGGCLPMFFQMPVFIALYRMLASSFELRHAPFFGWIVDLSGPDQLVKLPFSIPMIFFNFDAINVLPVLMALAMMASMWLTPQPAAAVNPQQQMMMRIMPVFFSVLCYNMSSGLNLYILTSTLLGIAQNAIIQRMDISVDVKKQPAPRGISASGKPKHFYNAAQAKKREMAKEMRKEKREKANTDVKGKQDRRP